MKTKLTSSMIMAMLFLVMSSAQTFAQVALDNRDEGHPNFTWIDDFEEGVALWWNPEGAGQSTGLIIEDDDGNLVTYRAHETEIVNPATGSIGSMKLAVVWDTDVEWFEPTAAGSASHYIRLYMPPGGANVPERRFYPGQALEIFVHGDGSNNRFKLMVRDGVNQLEGSQWFPIDWTGWKRFTWDYNDAANVFGWVNGNGEMTEGNPFYFDSIHITRNEAATTTEGVMYFDDLRIVDPFTASFNITNGDGSEVIAVNNVTYDAGETDIDLFPGEHQFFVYRDGFQTYYGTFEIDDEDVNIDITLNAGADSEYVVTFTVLDTAGDLINNAEITLNGEEYPAGQYVFELTPGFYDYEVSTAIHFPTEGSFAVIDGNVFINVELTEIPDLFDKVFLTWDVASTANQTQYREEYYSVWMGQAGADPAEFWMIFDETLSADIPNWEYQHRSIEISEYSQQNIQIAFRHHNITDMDRIVIDNVAIEGVNHGEEVDLLFFENFEGGVPDGFDPADPTYDEDWLPAGWEAIDADGDEFNWYFGIRVEQDLSYHAHMRSQSYDSGAGALTPDNWLFTPAIQMPLVVFYTATFVVVDDEGTPIQDAVVSIDGVAHDAGHYDFLLTNGEYHYVVSKDGYQSASGSFVLAGESIDVDVVLSVIPMFQVTFNVNMNQADGFTPGETDVYFTGNFPQFDWAAPGTIDEQKMDPTDNIYIFTRTLELPAGTYEYKYFDGPSFDNGEWPGGDNRVVVVEDDMEVNDVFGTVDPNFIHETDGGVFSIFPNPARDIVSISSEGQIQKISIYNLGGQLVYDMAVNSNTATINLNDFNPGLYLLSIIGNDSHSVHKLQITR